MIDFFLKIHTGNAKETGKAKPYTGMSYYMKYIKHINEIVINNVYYFTNSWEKDSHVNSYFENDKIVFFLFGKVFFRNILLDKSRNNLKIEQVFRLLQDAPSLVNNIKGNYACVLYHKADHKVEIINSPFGVIPLNYSVINGEILISSNLTMIKTQLPCVSVNKSALLQLSLFDTILGNNTLVSKINQIQYGQKVIIKGGRITIEKIYDHSKLFADEPVDRREAIDEIVNTLRTNSESWAYNEPILLGLTGGYDCRLNLALIPKSYLNNIIAYTYGMSGSKEIKIAKDITKRLNLRHEIILLDEEYEKHYSSLADEVLMLGDGFTPYMRANYYYAHSYLSKYSNQCITGMYGSEFIKPMHVMEDSVSINSQTVIAFFSENIDDALVHYFDTIKETKKTFYSDIILSKDTLDETIEMINELYIKPDQHLSKEGIIFDFYLNEGMRKFFMELIRIDKFFIDNTIPYLDLDFLELLLKSKYAGVYNNIFQSLYKRRKGQLLYVDAMHLIDPELNNIPVDRGYKPKYLRSEIGWIFVASGYVFGKKMRNFIKGNTTYNQKKWGRSVFEDNIKVLYSESDLFNNNLFDMYNTGVYLKNTHLFGRHYSIKKWLSLNGLLS